MKKAGLVVSSGILLVLVFALSGCGANPSLTSIAVQPGAGTAVVQAQGQTVQFHAIGSYLKSNKTTYSQDITTQVTWESYPSSVATINSSGLATAVSSGVSSVTASLDNQVGTSNIAVDPGNSVPALTISNADVGTGAGTVTSSPGPINCGTGGAVCSVFYPSPTAVILTATPTASSTFGGWSTNCTPNTVPTSPAPALGEAFSCTVDVSASTTVEAIFY